MDRQGERPQDQLLHSRTKLSRFVWAVLSGPLVATVCAVGAMSGQASGYTLSQIAKLMQSGSLSEQDWVNIETECVDFEVTPRAKQELVQRGATTALLERLSDTCNTVSSPWERPRVERMSVILPGGMGVLGKVPGRVWGYWSVAPVGCQRVSMVYACEVQVANGDNNSHHVCVSNGSLSLVHDNTQASPGKVAAWNPNAGGAVRQDSALWESRRCFTIAPHSLWLVSLRAAFAVNSSPRLAVEFDLADPAAPTSPHRAPVGRFSFPAMYIEGP
jgi:hypothetical protein